eukprot:CAMPEP_0204590130 /NCGR_PEP_ID=MMETSP0661-20131031/49615_1 /ASSEMBLY_ACC=CAM_ASM_000606 /TAXON_ID=109239 /ORGANISM="Alexandrium margalefi, Strain AMGDE01CS-322" /LENGTH=53 /DNA_ID=CAMNT_0051600137 /DNA_START=303 /DNA_END=460 /DNA_ORIENTATION=+
MTTSEKPILNFRKNHGKKGEARREGAGSLATCRGRASSSGQGRGRQTRPAVFA